VGRYTFGPAKQRRSVAKRPTGVLGRLRADRPGQYVLLDSYRLDVFAMEPVTLRWVNTELTVAMDLFDRCITGLRLRPVAARSPDVASVLFQTVTPQTWGWAAGSPQGPYAGLPDGIVLGDPDGVLPDTIVVDHGKIYLSEHTRSVCSRLGISIQPAIPDKPTDKPSLERFFRTLRQSLLEHLPGYKGLDVAAGGHQVEGGAFYYVGELEQLIREWVGRVYHHTAHAGHDVGRDQVARLMRTEGIEGVRRARRVRTTRPDPGVPRHPDLVKRDFIATSPNQLWVTDLAYLPTWTGVAYVCFIIDAYFRMIVGWRVAPHMRTTMVLDAIEMARWSRGTRLQGLRCHSDAGSPHSRRCATASDSSRSAPLPPLEPSATPSITRWPRPSTAATTRRADPRTRPTRPVEDRRGRRAHHLGLGSLA